MGKSNRIRANRADVQVKSLGEKPKKKGMPSWLMTLLTVSITLIILVGVVLSLMASNGVFKRMTTVVSTDNYKVNANMIAYYFGVQYNEFHTNYESILSNSTLNTDLSLKTQTIDPKNIYDSSLTGGFTGTWYDFFMKQTLDSVSTMLIYCEEADTLGVTLSKEDKAAIEDEIDAVAASLVNTGYTLDGYFTMMYGEGVQVSDVRKAMQYSALANKCASKIAENLDTAITDGRIDEAYKKDPSKFNKIDYLTIALSTSYANIQKELFDDTTYDKLSAEQKEEVQKEYDKRVAEFKELAEAMKKATDEKSFKLAVTPYITNNAYDALYDSTLTTYNKTATDEAVKKGEIKKGESKTIDMPSEEDIESIKNAVVTEILTALEKGEDKPATTITIPKDAETVAVFGKTVGKDFAGVINVVLKGLLEDVKESLDGMDYEKANKVDSNEFSKWAFEAGRKLMETKSIETQTKLVTTEKAGTGETKDQSKQTYSISTYMVTKLPYKDTEHTRNALYMLLNDQTNAKAAIEELKKKATINEEAFEAVASAKQAQHSHLDNYAAGSIGSAEFDAWLFDEKLKVNAITETPVKISSYYAVAIYLGEGEEQWKVEVESSIFSEDSANYEKTITEKYAVKVNDAKVAKLDFAG